MNNIIEIDNDDFNFKEENNFDYIGNVDFGV